MSGVVMWRVLSFPTVFGGALCATWWMLTHGYSGATTVFSVCSVAAVAVTLLERWLPYEAAWSESHDDLLTDLFYAGSSMLAAPRLFDTLALTALLQLSQTVSPVMGWWPGDWPWGVQLILAVVIAEFGSYWWHRAMHETALFRLHATHHSAPRLYWLNATRFHPFDNVIMYALHVVPLTLMGVEESVLVGFTVWSLVHGFFQHANVDVRLGPLNYIFSMSELHRWHHSRELSESNRNYGSNVIVWDLVFGTFFWPAGRRPPSDVGLYELPHFPQRVWGQLMSVFVWPPGQPEGRR